MTQLEPWCRRKFFKYDLLHIPHNLDVVQPAENYVVTLHDVIGYDIAKYNGNSKAVSHWERMARNAAGIITCSLFSKSEIVNKLGVAADKVDVAYWGISHEKFHMLGHDIVQSTLSRIGINTPYFLSVSCSHPRKNIRRLLEAYRKFTSKSPVHKLVLLWSNPPADICETYAKEIENKQVIFLDYVSDQDLVALYNGASCTLFPSRSEGFGFPILESFACGTPVMTCRNSCLPEVGKDVAIYVGEDNVDEMVDVMSLFENGLFDKDEFLIQSKNLLAHFSWGETAKSYIAFYEKHL